jgi:hypothetical protein
MDVSLVAAVGSFVMSERLIKPKAFIMVGLALLLMHDLATHSNDAASLRIYRGPGFLAFALFCGALSLRLWRRNGIACDELLFLPGTPLEDERQRHGEWREELWNLFGLEYRASSSSNTTTSTTGRSRRYQSLLVDDNNNNNNNNNVDVDTGDNNNDHTHTLLASSAAVQQQGGESSTEQATPTAAASMLELQTGSSLRSRTHSTDDGNNNWSHNSGSDQVIVDGHLAEATAAMSMSRTGSNSNASIDNNNNTGEGAAATSTSQQEHLMANFLSICGLSFLPFFQRVRQSQLQQQEEAERNASNAATVTTSASTTTTTTTTTTLNWAYSPSGAATTGAALDLALPVLMNFHLFIAAYNHPKYAEADTPKIFPLIFFTVLNIRAHVPPAKRRRFWSSLQYTMLPPIFNVKFRDEIIGDVMTSLTRPLQDIAFSYVYYITVLFHQEDIGQAAQLCQDSWLLQLWILPGVAILPLWWRFLQCLRQARDHRCRWPYYGNAFKYLTATLIVLYDIAHGVPTGNSSSASGAAASSADTDTAMMVEDNYNSTITWSPSPDYDVIHSSNDNSNDPEEEFHRRSWWIVCFVLATLYQIWWDTFVDWELFVLDTKNAALVADQDGDGDGDRTYNIEEQEEGESLIGVAAAGNNSASKDAGMTTSTATTTATKTGAPNTDTSSAKTKKPNSKPFKWTWSNMSKLTFKLRTRRMYRTNERWYYGIFWINCCFRFLWMLSFIPARHIAAQDEDVSMSMRLFTSHSKVHFVNSYSADMQSYFGPIIACGEIIRRCLWAILRVELESIKLYNSHFHEEHEHDHAAQEGDVDENIHIPAAGRTRVVTSPAQTTNKKEIELSSLPLKKDIFVKANPHIVHLPVGGGGDCEQDDHDDDDDDDLEVDGNGNNMDVDGDVSPLMHHGSSTGNTSTSRDLLTNRGSRHNKSSGPSSNVNVGNNSMFTGRAARLRSSMGHMEIVRCHNLPLYANIFRKDTQFGAHPLGGGICVGWHPCRPSIDRHSLCISEILS